MGRLICGEQEALYGVQGMGIIAMGLGKHLFGMTALALCCAAPALAETGNGVGSQFELAFWQSVTGSDDATLYEAYLQQYPSGTFGALARAKVVILRKGPAPVVPSQVESLPSVPPLPKNVRIAYGGVKGIYAEAEPTDDSALLEELAKSQEVGGASLQAAAAPVPVQGFALPARPVMSDVPELPLPSAFCSAEQRNAFHETRYKPVMEIARANNAVAVAHMQRLQQEYDSLQLARDTTPMNAIAHEASDYQHVAEQAYNRQIAIVQQFQTMMAVPVNTCQMAAAQ